MIITKFIKHKLSHHILFTSLFIFLLFNATYLYNINQKAVLNTRVSKNIVKLLLLDKRLDLNFYKQMNFINYDILNNDMNEFRKTLIIIDADNKENGFFSDQNNEESFKSLEYKFLEKKGVIRRFAAANSALNSSLRNLMNIYDELRKEDVLDLQMLQVGNVHSDVLQLKLGVDVNPSEIKNKIKTYENTTQNLHVKSFYNHAKTVLRYIDAVNDESLTNDKIHFGEQLEKFRTNFSDYSEDMLDKLYAYMALFVIIIVFFVIFVSLLLSKVKERTKNLLQFQQAVQNSDNTVVLTSPDYKITYVNSAFERATGYSKKEAIGQTPAILQSGLHDKKFYDDLKFKIKNGENWVGEFTNRRKDGRIVYERASIFPMLNDSHELDGYLAIKLDITGEKSHLQEIEAKNMEILARYQIDEATGLWSRNVLDDELLRKTEGYLIYLKIDNFEEIRLFYGTVITNEVIKKIANNLKRFISIYKIFGQPFRLGEDAFCLWYKHKRPSESLLEAIFDYFKANIIEHDGALHVIELKIGVSTDLDLPQGDRLLQAYIALSKAKKSGVSHVYYEQNNEQEKEYRQNVMTAQRIRNAISEDLITVQCQPIFYTDTKKPYCYEVLMRMYDENGRMMYPSEFLQIAKQSSLYTQLMHHVIVLTFDLLKTNPDMKFSINMSVIDILDHDTSKLFSSLLSSCENPQNIIIEILESEGIENYDAIKPFLQNARELGCLLSIDDFGSGYSNYYRIMQLQIDHIKIDGSIIKELPYDKNSRVVVETIIGFAKRKGCKVVAEFVSNEEIYNEVKRYGIEYTQGYYLGKPVKIGGGGVNRPLP